MILPHTDRTMARTVAERIRRAVENFVFLESKLGELGVGDGKISRKTQVQKFIFNF